MLVEHIEEHEDGSATLTVDLDEEEQKLLVSFALKVILTLAAYETTWEEAYSKVVRNEHGG